MKLKFSEEKNYLKLEIQPLSHFSRAPWPCALDSAERIWLSARVRRTACPREADGQLYNQGQCGGT
jgi:hypothetical protein